MAAKKRKKARNIERLMIFSVFSVVILVVATIFVNAQLSSVNIKVERLKNKVNTQEKVNESLTMKVNQLVSLDNLQTVALEKGLVYNSNNIVTVKK